MVRSSADDGSGPPVTARSTAQRTPCRPTHPPHHPHVRKRRSLSCFPTCTLPISIDTTPAPISSTATHNPLASHTAPDANPDASTTYAATRVCASHISSMQQLSPQNHQHTQLCTPPAHPLATPMALPGCRPFPPVPSSPIVPQTTDQNNTSRSSPRSKCSFTYTSCNGLVWDSLVA